MCGASGWHAERWWTAPSLQDLSFNISLTKHEQYTQSTPHLSPSGVHPIPQYKQREFLTSKQQHECPPPPPTHTHLHTPARTTTTHTPARSDHHSSAVANTWVWQRPSPWHEVGGGGGAMRGCGGEGGVLEKEEDVGKLAATHPHLPAPAPHPLILPPPPYPPAPLHPHTPPPSLPPEPLPPHLRPH